jgi:hypothetical protein
MPWEQIVMSDTAELYRSASEALNYCGPFSAPKAPQYGLRNVRQPVVYGRRRARLFHSFRCWLHRLLKCACS